MSEKKSENDCKKIKKLLYEKYCRKYSHEKNSSEESKEVENHTRDTYST